MIDACIISKNRNVSRNLIAHLRVQSVINKIFLIKNFNDSFKGVSELRTDYPFSSEAFKYISSTSSKYILLIYSDEEIKLLPESISNFVNTIENQNAGFVYSDFNLIKDKTLSKIPLLDYQIGSIRDEFNFGKIVLLNTACLKKWAFEITNLKHSAFYSLRLFISRVNKIYHIPESLYSVNVTSHNSSMEAQFNYVDPVNIEIQKEHEIVFTQHLKNINAFIKAGKQIENYNSKNYEYEASVIIPVKNRVNTIQEAITSVLSQKCNFKFNVIVVNNLSNDGTTELLNQISDERLLHLIPKEKHLEIGGCWNHAINSPHCGRFAIQLDSDDLYQDDNVIQKIVDKFYEDKSAAVVGSYSLTNFDKQIIPPGIITHSEWTDNNGQNNTLRINGLGAPRAFFTKIVRDIQFPNVSYGEDYSVMIQILRKYKISRIYDSIYICRRWSGNSDANLDIEKENRFNNYKDSLRSTEILARIKLNEK